MYRKRKRLFFGLPFIIAAAILLLGFIVMLLWNFIFPSIFHTQEITYWQAVGLLVLCRILFFGFRKPHRDHRPGMWHGGPPWRQKWMNMSDEERAKFREEWKTRCRKPEEKE
ncbi:MAG TPA: hypothetical protein VGI61_11520 [Parafilimonas sp.]|jgi:hypothetical protein